MQELLDTKGVLLEQLQLDDSQPLVTDHLDHMHGSQLLQVHLHNRCILSFERDSSC